ncbi:SCYL2 protein, partial [Coccidioides immitis H538.4]
MRLLADNCSGKDFKDDVWPLIHLGLDSPIHSLVDASLRCLPVMLPVLDFSTVKDEVFPPIALVFSKTSSLTIKIRGLEAFVILCGGTVDAMGSTDELSGVISNSRSLSSSHTSILDKFTIQEKVVPLLKAIKTKEPAVMMAALNVFKQIGQIVDMEFLALDVLPIMWAFSLGPLLNVQQFSSYVDLIKSLSTRIETEQKKKLQELSSSNGDKSRNNTSSP